MEVHNIPRVAPKPVASGISVRKTPKPSLEQVRRRGKHLPAASRVPRKQAVTENTPRCVLVGVAGSQLIKTCQHYEFKVAHRYDTKSMAARLLFQLSHEIQELVVALMNAGFGKSPKLEHLEVSAAATCPRCIVPR